MKNLEKMQSFQVKNKKLETVLGGQAAPVQSFINV